MTEKTDFEKKSCSDVKKDGNHVDGYDFEDAIKATEFGKFNYIMLLLILPACFTVVQESTSMSYVFPAAQCDLDLSLEDKGLLNAITYAGAIPSAFVWGYLFDVYGRKNILSFGLFFNGFFVFLSAFSQNLTYLLLLKFCGGLIMGGPWAGMASYLTEIHGTKHRNQMPIIMGFAASLSTVLIPILAGYILPMDIKFSIGNMVFHSWSIFLFILSIPGFISSLCFLLCPESPKFLMSKGECEKALNVFKKIYAMNTGKSEDSYPIKHLRMTMKSLDEKIEDKSTWSSIKEGFGQISPLLGKQHIKKFFLVCMIQLFILFNLNTLRLWSPQVLQAINDYQFLNNGSSSDLCEMISILRPAASNVTTECFVNFDNSDVYLYLTFINLVLAVLYFFSIFFMGCIGPKNLIYIVNVAVAIFSIALYYAPDGVLAVIFIAGFTAFGSLGSSVIVTITVNLFPTKLRTMAVSLMMMTGRGAAMAGNIIFPFLLEIGCAPPFIVFAVLSCACFLITIPVPKGSRRESIMVQNIVISSK